MDKSIYVFGDKTSQAVSGISFDIAVVIVTHLTCLQQDVKLRLNLDRSKTWMGPTQFISVSCGQPSYRASGYVKLLSAQGGQTVQLTVNFRFTGRSVESCYKLKLK